MLKKKDTKPHVTSLDQYKVEKLGAITSQVVINELQDLEQSVGIDAIVVVTMDKNGGIHFKANDSNVLTCIGLTDCLRAKLTNYMTGE
jgi:hypothetical protein